MEDVKDIGNIINNYDCLVSRMPKKMKSNNKEFNRKFEEIVENLFKDKKI